ncbi:Hpt domain-containing protein [Bdellovibrio sp. HCB209]|uniref:Hpt domain-containing protein n=1 Tax=Bdellovibrio sp. HCB209 TaxID=3394354 RepID=UPI0039B63098
MSSSVIDKSVWNDLREFEKAEGAEGFFEQLLKTVLESSRGQMDGLIKSSDAADPKKTHYYAHTLKSTSASLGAKGLAGYLGMVEKGCKEDPPIINFDAINAAKDLYEIFIKEVQEEYDRIQNAAV